MKCWNCLRNAECQHFNAQGSRGIIVAGQAGAVKVYVAAMDGAAQEKRKTGWNSGTIKIDGFSKFDPSLNANAVFRRFFFFFESHRVYDETQGTGAGFSCLYGYLYYLSEMTKFSKKNFFQRTKVLWRNFFVHLL